MYVSLHSDGVHNVGTLLRTTPNGSFPHTLWGDLWSNTYVCSVYGRDVLLACAHDGDWVYVVCPHGMGWIRKTYVEPV